MTNSPQQSTTTSGFPLAHLGARLLRPNLPNTFEGAIFDLDGTLLDSMPYWENLGEDYLIARGKTPAPDIRYHFKRLTLEGSAIYMKETYGLSESVAEIAKGIMAGIENNYRQVIPLKEGAAQALKSFANRGVAMCVATATERHCAEAALERLGVLPYFSSIFTCSEVGASKTSPLIFNVAREHLGTPAGRTLVFEDSLHAIETARAAGLLCAAVHEPSAASDADAIMNLADMYLQTFADVAQ